LVDSGPDYRITCATLKQNTTRAIERVDEPVSVPDSMRRKVIADLTEGARGQPDDGDPDRIPRTFPPFEQFHLATTGNRGPRWGWTTP